MSGGDAPGARPRGPGTLAAAATILRKDLLIELRARESLPAAAIFVVITFVVFHFALDQRAVAGDLAAGVFWVTVLFAAVLAINRLLVAEREQGGFDALRLAPIDATAVLLAKVAGLFILLSVIEALALGAFALLLLDPGLGQALPELPAILAAANLGIAAIGVLIASLAIHTRARELITPLLTLPLTLPVLIGAARATSPLFADPAGAADLARWLGLIGLYDMVFVLIAYAVYDFLLDD